MISYCPKRFQRWGFAFNTTNRSIEVSLGHYWWAAIVVAILAFGFMTTAHAAPKNPDLNTRSPAFQRQ